MWPFICFERLSRETQWCACPGFCITESVCPLATVFWLIDSERVHALHRAAFVAYSQGYEKARQELEPQIATEEEKRILRKLRDRRTQAA